MTQAEKLAETARRLEPRSAHRAVRLGKDGSCWIEGQRCDDCGAVFADAAIACRRCASRTPPAPVRFAGTGQLYSWSIIHRSYPGIAVPFVSAVVDLDGGLTLKGTLRGVDMAGLRPGLAVRAVFDDVGGAIDKDGAPYVGFHFVPGENAHG